MADASTGARDEDEAKSAPAGVTGRQDQAGRGVARSSGDGTAAHSDGASTATESDDSEDEGSSDSDDGLALLATERKPAQRGRKRQRAASGASDGSEGGGGSDGSDDGSSSDDDELQVDFDFQDPREIHYLSVKRFLCGMLPGVPMEKLPLRDLTDVIVKQAAVGTMVTADDTGDAYAFISAINMETHKV